MVDRRRSVGPSLFPLVHLISVRSDLCRPDRSFDPKVKGPTEGIKDCLMKSFPGLARAAALLPLFITFSAAAELILGSDSHPQPLGLFRPIPVLFHLSVNTPLTFFPETKQY